MLTTGWKGLATVFVVALAAIWVSNNVGMVRKITGPRSA